MRGCAWSTNRRVTTSLRRDAETSARRFSLRDVAEATSTGNANTSRTRIQVRCWSRCESAADCAIWPGSPWGRHLSESCSPVGDRWALRGRIFGSETSCRPREARGRLPNRRRYSRTQNWTLYCPGRKSWRRKPLRKQDLQLATWRNPLSRPASSAARPPLHAAVRQRPQVGRAPDISLSSRPSQFAVAFRAVDSGPAAAHSVAAVYGEGAAALAGV